MSPFLGKDVLKDVERGGPLDYPGKPHCKGKYPFQGKVE
jgi:hypothetical protein